MPLPEPRRGERTLWPPPEAVQELRLIREWAAWWSGDPDALLRVYGGSIGVVGPTDRPRTNVFRRFWERVAGSRDGTGSSERQRAYLHVPLAADIASTSAALLFSEPPTITIGAAHAERAEATAKAAEDELQRIRYEGALDSRLLEAADFAAGLGGVYLKPSWDKAIADYPLLSVVQPDQALGEFRFGILTAATLWRDVERNANGRDIVRHLERHEVGSDGRGVVLHRLYRGTDLELGEIMPDTELKAKTGLDPQVDLPFAGLGIHYVPNARPHRRLRGSPLGQSDYSGAEGMLDALDEAYASWMRDIRLGKARVFTARELLDGRGRFDLEHEVYAPLDVPATRQLGMNDQIAAQQFKIRYEEHSKTCLALIERIVDHGGYAPQSFGLQIEGRAETGTALNIRERKTFLTQQRKAAWFGPVIAAVAEQMLAISREVFSKPVEPVRPDVEISDSLARDDRQMAETVEIINRAEAASVETKIRMLHPEWDDAQVATEKAAILEERGLAVPSPLDVDGEGPAAPDRPIEIEYDDQGRPVRVR
jgi:hypothetical protein